MGPEQLYIFLSIGFAAIWVAAIANLLSASVEEWRQAGVNRNISLLIVVLIPFVAVLFLRRPPSKGKA